MSVSAAGGLHFLYLLRDSSKDVPLPSASTWPAGSMRRSAGRRANPLSPQPTDAKAFSLVRERCRSCHSFRRSRGAASASHHSRGFSPCGTSCACSTQCAKKSARRSQSRRRLGGRRLQVLEPASALAPLLCLQSAPRSSLDAGREARVERTGGTRRALRSSLHSVGS